MGIASLSSFFTSDQISGCSEQIFGYITSQEVDSGIHRWLEFVDGTLLRHCRQRPNFQTRISLSRLPLPPLEMRWSRSDFDDRETKISLISFRLVRIGISLATVQMLIITLPDLTLRRQLIFVHIYGMYCTYNTSANF